MGSVPKKLASEQLEIFNNKIIALNSHQQGQ
jgi:hypothetical protein